MKGIDLFLFVWYCVFAFTALVFEPAYYFGCNWNANVCELAASNDIIRMVRDVWLIYCRWDPMFYVVPMWLRVLCTIEVFLFGPLYAVVAYGLWAKAKWLTAWSLPFSGALIYSTIVYFAMEIIENLPGTNILIVFIVNIPWTIIPIILLYRVLQDKKAKTV